MRSAMDPLRLAAEIIHHASGQPLEAQLQGAAAEPAGVIEIQGEGDLASRIAQRDEIPDSLQAAERAIDQVHLQTPRRVDGVACGETLAEPGKLEIQPR